MNQAREIIRVEKVIKRFGRTLATNEVSLSIHEGEFFALLGPSGCGKTTLLRMLAGFETPDSGKIWLDGQDMVQLKPWQRPVNMMFQSYALFPHMSVYDNVAYGLRQDKLPKDQIDRRVKEVLELVGLYHLANRKPGSLSGGQKQRVALARAIVKRPRVLLLDEPLAALDRKLRVEMRLELKRLQNEVGIAFVFVTHDQEEALTMADRAAVMNVGEIQQIGTPEELYNLPANLYVAKFIGEANIFAGKLGTLGGEFAVIEEGGRYLVSASEVNRTGLRQGDSAAIVVRPEWMVLKPLESEAEQCLNCLQGTIIETAYLGSARTYVVETDDQRRIFVQSSTIDSQPIWAVGDRVLVGWQIERGVLVAGNMDGAEQL